MPSRLEHIRAILQLPFVVTIIIPLSIYLFGGESSLTPLFTVPISIRVTVALIALIIGISLFIHTLRLFDRIGKGTLAPWNPTRKMIIHGIYQYVRNPMLIGVNLILLSEALFLASGNILLWNLFFFISNHLYFVLKEEPDLMKRFGDEYEEYRNNVPRWIPRVKAWKPEL